MVCLIPVYLFSDVFQEFPWVTVAILWSSQTVLVQSFLCIVMEQLKRSQPSHMSANLPAGSKTTWNYESFKLSFKELFSTFIKLYRQRSGQEMMGKRCVPVPNSYRLYSVLQWLWHPVRFIQLVYVHILLVKCSLKPLIFLQTNSEFLLVPNRTALF